MTFKRSKALRAETHISTMIPYTAHMDKHIVRTDRGHYVQVFRLGGASFESADDEQINNWHERLNVFWRSISSPNFSVSVHLVRRRESGFPASTFSEGFASDLMAKYRKRMSRQTLMVNEIYVSLVYRPTPSKVGSLFMKALSRANDGEEAQEIADSIDTCQKKRQELMTAFARYDPDPLGIYDRNGTMHSSAIEFFGFLVNGHFERRTVPNGQIRNSLADTRPLFGNEAMEYRGATRTRVSAFLGISEYPPTSPPGFINSLLSTRFPFILTQSFEFIGKATAAKLLKEQRGRLRASEDDAQSQAEELDEAIDALASNLFAFGRHHFTLQVMAEHFDATKSAEEGQLKLLNDNLAEAKSILADSNIVTAREDLALEAAFWSQLPGNEHLRPRVAPMSSRNLAGFAPFHNYPGGRKAGNHWGQAATMFETTAQSPYFFSHHASDPRKADGGSRKDVGHMLVVGPVGSGKTVNVGFLIAAMTQFGARQVIFDNEEGLHILVRALGGRYRSLKVGQPTGLNPLQREPNGENVEFMKQLLRTLVDSQNRPLTVQEDKELNLALAGVLQISNKRDRRLSRLIEFLPPTNPEGLHARLQRWTHLFHGEYAWVFDNPEDNIDNFMDGAAIVGFDVTEFIKVPALAEPLSMYLLHVTNRLVNGQRMICWMDEFPQMIGRPAFAEFAKHGLETWRRKDASFVAVAQMTSHISRSEIARSLIEQTPTKIFFPNPEASYGEYVDDFGFSEREFFLIKQELQPGDRTFLIKQGNNSIVAKLDLKGFDFELDVISTRTRNIQVMNEAIQQAGEDPNNWLPVFKKALEDRAKKANHASTEEKNHVFA
ncbi:VirB4 family type IV secretion/conjugal transfer ATPase [Zoogloeaceae bacterium G21618-S1]|nr:VirB4 family type IV secretion/conjugal transfer ATPase [Zoogloeaceae bacterium G21618-S1]